MSEPVPEPRVFAPGVISTAQREYGLTFRPDGREVYFTRRPRRGPALIFHSRFSDGSWSEPQPAPFSREGDEAPFILPDGSALLFSSRRPARGRWDRSENIWLVERDGTGWSEPRPLPGTVNRPGREIDDFDVGMELGPFLLADGVLLYWTRVSPDWGSDIYVAEGNELGEFVDPRPLRLNSAGDESNPVLSPDGRHLIFQGYRGSDGYGDDDLYVSERTDYGWSTPRLLPEPINSPAFEGHPRFSPDGRHFFFASDRNRRYEDIYVVSTAALGLDDTGQAGDG
ncbi:MAG: hypothetical protein R3304_00370 [Longimicrobiales bacterium]|nr:hypothetical protein [Longimicrobiales bacterium]